MSKHAVAQSSIGLMLYSVREAAEHDFESTLREVAAIGYTGVEISDLHGHSPSQVRSWLDELGIVATSRHTRLGADLDALAAEARDLGWKRLVISWVDPDELDTIGRRLADTAAAAWARGLELGYHNHDAEIANGFVDRLPANVFLELDAGWAWWAGADPVDLLGRGPLVHIKDFRARGERSFCAVGDGAVGYERLVPIAARQAEWLLVEQDEADGDELGAARRSFLALDRMLAAER